MTKKLEEYAGNAGLTKSPDGLGYFGFNPNYNLYVEILSYDKVLADSKKRNRVFFDKLNIDHRPG